MLPKKLQKQEISYLSEYFGLGTLGVVTLVYFIHLRHLYYWASCCTEWGSCHSSGLSYNMICKPQKCLYICPLLSPSSLPPAAQLLACRFLQPVTSLGHFVTQQDNSGKVYNHQQSNTTSINPMTIINCLVSLQIIVLYCLNLKIKICFKHFIRTKFGLKAYQAKSNYYKFVLEW